MVATENNPQENRLTCCAPTLLFRFGATMADVDALVNTNDPCYLYDLSPPDETHIGYSSQQHPGFSFLPRASRQAAIVHHIKSILLKLGSLVDNCC